MEIAIGILIGVVLGLTGAGGSVFAVPLFLLLTDMNTNDAMGIALAAVAITASYGTLAYGRKQVLWTPALLLAVGGAASAPLGKCLALQLNENVLLVLFSVLAVLIAIRMWLHASRHPDDASVVRATQNIDGEETAQTLLCRLSPSGQFQLRPRCLSGLISGGLAIGFVSGLFGVGGGFLIVPLLIYLSQVPMRLAVSTSLFVIALVSSSGFLSHLVLSTSLPLQTLVPIMIASITGMIVSQLFSRKIAGSTLQKIFALALLFVSILCLVEKFL